MKTEQRLKTSDKARERARKKLEAVQKKLQRRVSKRKWTFDSFLAFQLQGLSFVTGGKFTSMDVMRYFTSDKPTFNQKTSDNLYQKEYKTSGFWRWNSFNDRLHRHLNRVVTAAGGSREKVSNRWVYNLSPKGFITGA